MIRLAQLLLLVSAAALWGASRMVWVEVQSFDGLGQPKTTALTGSSWSTALVPLAVLLLAAAVAALAVRGWPLRLFAVLVAAASALMAYLAISLWVIRDVAPRAAHLADVPITNLVSTQRHYAGAIVTLVAAVVTLLGAVLLVRSAARAKPEAARYERRSAASAQEAAAPSERAIWDALDEGRDPTDPDNKGR
ncbi:trp region conserved hypothetical membrane protein [Mycobacterium sp. JS623]|uniref:TIGR02234 family membrane protein n=1 Tax=Mycobacterium sp. JS623 TaxID=212767 RepID=UPI0002A54E76|nr:TIGR02234 family membrane protein [Mycobacterium sp. JS623]AGB23306.1 trp region conserved hypothetical membrane protein [Mycobacterium sp. JS623]